MRSITEAISRPPPSAIVILFRRDGLDSGAGAPEESRVNSRLGPVSELTRAPPLQRQGRAAASAATRGAGTQICRRLSDLRRPRSPSNAGNGGDPLEEGSSPEESRVNSRLQPRLEGRVLRSSRRLTPSARAWGEAPGGRGRRPDQGSRA